MAGGNAWEFAVSKPKFTLLSGSHALLVYGLSEHIMHLLFPEIFFLAGQASAAKEHFAGPCCVHGLEKDDRMTGYSLLHVCWRRLGTRQKKKKKKKKGDSVCSFTLAAGWESDKKGENLFDVPHLAQGYFV